VQSRKKILIISEAHLVKTFVQATISKIKEETGTQFDCFITSPIDEKTKQSLSSSFENIFVNQYPRGIVKKFPKVRVAQVVYGLRKIARKLPEYDIAHIHFHHFYFPFFTHIIRKKARKFFITFYGGDFDHVSNFKHWCNQKSMRLMDGVFAENEVMLQNIVRKYQVDERRSEIGTLIFLMNNFISFEPFLEKNTIESAKKVWGVKKNLVVCAYSAGMVMQHATIIEALNMIQDKLSDYKVIFPMTYGWRGDETRAMVKEKLTSSSFDSLVLEEYLTTDKLQALRLAADIFINIPSRDQMASSFLEHLAAGSVVITGKWLPYSKLVEKGVYFIEIDTAGDLSGALSSVLDNLEEHRQRSKVNRDIILNMMSWNSIKTNWYKYYGVSELP
jgi:glycosyltransferase involved in cell wall biosynthesis